MAFQGQFPVHKDQQKAWDMMSYSFISANSDHKSLIILEEKNLFLKV